jgi:hypothetical protein
MFATLRLHRPVLAVLLLVGVGAALRFVDLGADASPFKRAGDIVDEGYWSHNARQWALGVTAADDLVQADAAGPLYSVLVRASFWVFGVGYASARLPSALAGTALIVVLAALAWKAWGPREAVVAAAVASFGEAAVFYSRLCMPEILQTALLAGALLATAHRSRRADATAGALLSLACLTKITALYYAPAVLSVFWHVRRGPELRACLARFASSAAVLPSVWLATCLWPHRDAYLATYRMIAANNGDGSLLRFDLLRVPFGYFFGLPSVCLGAAAVAVGAMDPIERADPWFRRLLLFGGSFLVVVAVTADKLDRRFVPLLAPVVLATARVVARTALRSRPWRALVAAAAVSSVTLTAAWQGSLREAFGVGTLRMVALAALAATLLALLAFLLRPRERAARWALVVAACGGCAPVALGSVRTTQTQRAAAASLDAAVGGGCVVTGPFANSFALEGSFTPVFRAPGAVGIDRMNAAVDPSTLDFQLVLPELTTIWGAPGLDRPDAYQLASYRILPDFTGHPRYRLQLHALGSGRCARRSN